MGPAILRSFEHILAVAFGGMSILLGCRRFLALPQQRDSGLDEEAWVREMQTRITHPLTAERLKALAAAIEREGGGRAPANGEIWDFVATKLLGVADILADLDLQQGIAVAAARAPVSKLAPGPPGATENCLRHCAKEP
jgi:hypothetical protein